MSPGTGTKTAARATGLLAFLALASTAALAACRTAGREPVSNPGPTSSHAALEPISASALCVGAGKVESTGTQRLRVDLGGVRAVIAGDRSRTAELAFTYWGPSVSAAPLASGELRRQIGLKLRAQDTCNVVYVMWHVEPSPGIFVSVKRNPGASTHGECGARGYEGVKPQAGGPAPVVEPGVPHFLGAVLAGEDLVVTGDGIVVWRGQLPPAAFAFDGPAGVRSDNGTFDFELRVPGGHHAGGTCR